MKIKTSLILTVAALALSGSALAEVKIALVAKSLGNGFFEAANVGAQEAAKELGDVKVIYTGPTTTTAEAQIEVLNGLIAQGVDAIAISANDPDAAGAGTEESDAARHQSGLLGFRRGESGSSDPSEPIQ
jgi:rhamnose transport system substrate-binding protein